MDAAFSRNFHIAAPLSLSGLLTMQQDTANAQLEALGAPINFLLARQETFVLVRTAAVVKRWPCVGESVTMTTWARPEQGAQYYRCFSLTCGDELLVDSVSVYVMIHTVSRRILRPRDTGLQGVIPSVDRHNTCPDPQKFEGDAPDNFVGNYTVPHDRIDWNGHLNNTYYADILMENIPSVYRETPPKGFQIHYAHELLEGETVALFAASQGSTARLCGKRDGVICFEGTVTV